MPCRLDLKPLNHWRFLLAVLALLSAGALSLDAQEQAIGARENQKDKVLLRKIGEFRTHRQPVAAAAGDFDEDGNQDLVIANFGSNDVSILAADGKGGFGSPEHFLAGNGPRAVAVGDFSQDGHLDVAVANEGDSTVSILLGDGRGHFLLSATHRVGIRPIAVVAGDFNLDGNLDLAVANSSSRDIIILLSDARTLFSVTQTIKLPGSPVGLVAADMRYEGRRSLVTATTGENHLLAYHFNNEGVFERGTELPLDLTPVAVAVSDLNGDDAADLALSAEGSIQFFYGKGRGRGYRLNESRTVFVDGGPSSVAFIDLKGASQTDITAASPFPCMGFKRFGLQAEGKLQPGSILCAGQSESRLFSFDFTGHSKQFIVSLDSIADRGMIFEADKFGTSPTPSTPLANFPNGPIFPLSFPLQTGPSIDPWSASITSTMDHSMVTSYTADSMVVTFTGELGNTNPSPVPGTTLSGFGNANQPSFMLNGSYTGGGDSTRLYYDGHPGYDYSTSLQNITVFAAADGVTADRGNCLGSVVLDHQNGLKTVYLHFDSLNASVTDASGAYQLGKQVPRGTPIGITGGRGCSGNATAFPVHLHFEVRKNDIPVDPYGWDGNLSGHGTDPYRRESNVLLWGPRPVDWSPLPPQTVSSGSTINLSWTVSGTAIHTNVHFDSYEDLSASACLSRPSCQSSTPQSGSGSFSSNVTVPTVTTQKAFYFMAHATISGRHYYSPVVQITVSVPAKMLSPAPGSTLSSSSETFKWDSGFGVGQYWLWVGRSLGGKDIYSQTQGTNLSATVNNLPTDGSTIYVRLWSLVGSSWLFNAYTYTACSGCGGTAVISIAPASINFGSVSTGSSVDRAFTVQNKGSGTLSGIASVTAPFSVVSGATYNLSAGQSQSVTVRFNPGAAQSYSQNVTFSEVSGGSGTGQVLGIGTVAATPAVMITPASGSTLSSSSANFTWNSGNGVSQYWLYVGRSVGSNDIYNQSQGTSLSVALSSLPTDGSTIFVRLWSLIGSTWQFRDYNYKASGGGGGIAAAMISPAPGSTLSSSSVNFAWNSGSGVSQFWLYVGRSVGSNDIYSQNQGTNLSVTVNNLPSGTIFVRLWSWISSRWLFRDYTYTVVITGVGIPAAMISPVPGSTLSSPSVTFTWNTGTGVSQYWLFVGRSTGGNDIYSQSQGTNLSATVNINNLPTDGSTIYVRLWSLINNGWQFRDYTYRGGVSIGQVVFGTLSVIAPSGSCNFGAPADRYFLSLPTQTSVDISLTSPAFDTFLCVFNSSNSLIAKYDDSGGGLDSRLVLTLPTGDYFIEATSFSGSGVGAYTLSLQGAVASSATSINVGQTLVANLTAPDPVGCRFGAPAKRYSFSIASTTTLTIDAVAHGFDAEICLRNASNFVIAQDQGRGPGSDARLITTLSVGSYSVEVTTESGALGLFTLSLQQGFPPSKPLSVGQIVNGNLHSTAAEGICQFRPVDRYVFTLASPATVTIDLSSSAFDTFLGLLNSQNQCINSDNDRGPGSNARLVVSLGTGTYFIEAITVSSGNTGGPYTLSLQPGLPPATAISVGQTLNGTLSGTAAEGICQFRPVDRYTFMLASPTTVTIDLSSSAFDTYIGVLNSQNQCIASDNDRGPGSNARLVVSLGVGTYYIEAMDNIFGGNGGPYTLSLQPGLPPAIAISVGQTLNGTLDSTAAEGICQFRPVDRYVFTLASPATVTIDLSSSAFDTYVGLLNSQNQCIGADNNSGGGTNSRIVMSLQAGTYYIEAVTVSSGNTGGPYTLSLQ